MDLAREDQSIELFGQSTGGLVLVTECFFFGELF